MGNVVKITEARTKLALENLQELVTNDPTRFIPVWIMHPCNEAGLTYKLLRGTVCPDCKKEIMIGREE